MLNKKELEKIVNALPLKNYQAVADKLEGVSADVVRKILHEPRRYRKDVIDAAILVIKEHKADVLLQKELIKQL